jgi:hypothetical protein
MKKLLLISVAITLALAYTTSAADFSIGLRMGHNHPTGGTDWWDDYVSGRMFDAYTYEDGTWTKSDALARGSSAQNDDFSNLNRIPALRGVLRFEKFDLILFDIELWDHPDVRIADAALGSAKRGARYVWEINEEVDLRVISLRNMAAWRFDTNAGHWYVGGGIGWHFWSIDSNLIYNEYTAYDSKYKKYNVTDSAEYNYDDSGLAVGVGVIAGYEHEMTDLLRPFVDISFEYAVAKWEPGNLSSDPWDRIPSEPFDNPDSHEEKYYVPKFKIKDSYDANLGGIKISFGMNFMF